MRIRLLTVLGLDGVPDEPPRRVCTARILSATDANYTSNDTGFYSYNSINILS